MIETYIDGILREFRDDTTRTVTTYDENGAVTLTRPYTPAENTAANATASLEIAAASKSSLDQKVRNAVKVDGSLKALLGSGTDTAPALTNAAIKVASLRALNKLTSAELGANAGPILNRLISIMIELIVYDRQNGKLTVNLFDEAQ